MRFDVDRAGMTFASMTHGRLPSAILAACLLPALLAQPVSGLVIVDDGEAKAVVYADTRGAAGKNAEVLRGAAKWLAEAVTTATGADIAVVDAVPAGPAVVVARADQYPAIARGAELDATNIDAFVVVSGAERVHILGNSEVAARHGVATLLHRLGFRYYAPSPRWWIAPAGKDLAIDVTLADAPAMRGRRVWYAYGVREPHLREGYDRWSAAMRMGSAAGFATGHSYHNIYTRNKAAFEAHPEFFALLEDGTRQVTPHGKFCVSNPELIELVVADRLKLLEAQRAQNPYSFMVSVDPSDGQGTCHCDNCAAIGTPTDRVMHLANEVARGLRAKHPDAWVGLYAYSSHRMPPTIDIEPNVYVQVAMGFNRTPYTLPQLVSKWAEKVSMMGLREYYGVEAWDWGLPGQMRGASADYHRKWIPYYYARNVNAVNAESNANWGGQTLGFLVAAQLMWNPAADVDAVIADYYRNAYGAAAAPMRKLQAKFDAKPALRVPLLLAMYRDVQAAFDAANSDAVRARVIDMMAYLHYVRLYRDYRLATQGDNEARDNEYAALLPLMQYAWQTRLRGMVHYYALARRLCNVKPLRDGRPEYHMFGHGENKQEPPIWQVGEELGDSDIVARFRDDIRLLESEPDPYVPYSARFERVIVPTGADAGPCRVDRQTDASTAEFRKGLDAVIDVAAGGPVEFTVTGRSRSTSVRVTGRRRALLLEQAVPSDETARIVVDLPRGGSYRVRFDGTFRLQVPAATPLVFEASYGSPAWIDYSGPHYFYVPKGTTELIFDCGPRLSLVVPGQGRRDFSTADRAPGSHYVVFEVPEGADGQVWHTSSQTRGQVAFINLPPYLSFHRDHTVVPAEVMETDALTVHRPTLQPDAD